MDPDRVWFNHLQRSLNFFPQNGRSYPSMMIPESSHIARDTSPTIWSPSLTSAAQSALLSAYMLHFFPPPPSHNPQSQPLPLTLPPTLEQAPSSSDSPNSDRESDSRKNSSENKD